VTFVLQMLETGKERSPIHALDPRAKLIWWICLIVVPILVTNPLVLLLITLLIWGLARQARVAGRMLAFLGVSYPIMIGFIMFTWPFFYTKSPDQHYLFDWWVLHASWEGIFYAFAMGMRIVMALTACVLFVMTTDLMDLAGSVGEFLQERFRISYTVPLMVISSFKFLPEMSGDYLTITNVFRSRALDIDTGSIVDRFRKTIPVAIPLIDGMLQRAQIIAIALELKAFSPANKNRTFFYEHHFTGADFRFILLGLGLVGLGLALTLAGWSRVEVFL
jgi:energy-coupling factor transport system permease protein